MPRIRREIHAEKIEYVCDRCERGVYRLARKRPVTTDYILKWRHRCTHCGEVADFAVPYPVIEVDVKPVKRVFIQREALPIPSGPSSRMANSEDNAKNIRMWRLSVLPFKLPFLGEIC